MLRSFTGAESRSRNTRCPMASGLSLRCSRSGVIANTSGIIAVVLLTCTLGHAHGSSVAKQAWTQARTSPGLHRLHHDVVATYQAPARIPKGAVISQVYAHRDYVGQADVQTSICWKTTDHCVDITGRSVNTRSFEGMSAEGPMLLVHRA